MENRQLEGTDVDPELQGVGADHPPDGAVPQSPLDCPALVRQVAAAVSRNLAGGEGAIFEVLPDPVEEQFHVRPGSGEHDRADVVGQGFRCNVRRLVQGRTADSHGPVHQGRVLDHHVFLVPGGPVFHDQLDRFLQEGLRQFPGVGDGGRAADERRFRAVEGADALEPADHVGQVGAEDPPVPVEFVQDDVAEVLEKLDPLGVVGQDARVEHVGVRDHHVSRRADLGPGAGGGVTVVGEAGDVGLHRFREGVQFSQLVLAQGLGGEEVERPGRGVFEDGLHHRDVVAGGLAAGRRRDDDHVPALHGGADGFGLVEVGPLDAPQGQGVRQPGVQGGPRAEPGFLGREGSPDGHLPGARRDPFQQFLDFFPGFAEHGRHHLCPKSTPRWGRIIGGG